MGRDQYLIGPFGMPQMGNQGQGGTDQEGQCGDQGQLIGWAQDLHLEYAFKGGQDKCPRHQSGQIGVQHNQDAPLQFNLIGIDKAIHLGEHVVKMRFHN